MEQTARMRLRAVLDSWEEERATEAFWLRTDREAHHERGILNGLTAMLCPITESSRPLSAEEREILEVIVESTPKGERYLSQEFREIARDLLKEDAR